MLDPELQRLARPFLLFLEERKERYPDALTFGLTFPVRLAIEAKHRRQDPTFTPATCVCDHMLGSQALREHHETPLATEDFEFALRWRARKENRTLTDDEVHGYVGGVVLFASASLWYMAGRHEDGFVDMVAHPAGGWPAFRCLSRAQKTDAVAFIEESETWAKEVVNRDDVIGGREFMDKLVVRSEHERLNAPRVRGIRTARDTLVLHSVMLAAAWAGKLGAWAAP